jgi:hypothetical protein
MIEQDNHKVSTGWAKLVHTTFLKSFPLDSDCREQTRVIMNVWRSSNKEW